MVRHLLSRSTAVIVAVVVLAAGGSAAASTPDDPDAGSADPEATARADAAIAAFEQRMTDNGLVNTGPQDDDDDGDDSDDSDDDAFLECGEMSGQILEALGEASDDAFPGQLAEVSSDQFSTAAADENASGLEGEEFVAANVVIIDAGAVAQADEVIDVFSSAEFAECFEQAFEREILTELEADGAGDVPPPQIAITAADPGIGDNSARFGLEFALVYLFPISFDLEVVMARQGSDLVMVMHASVLQEPELDFDSVAEAELVLADLAAG